MTPATLKALQGSIRKWQRILKGEEADHGSRNCPLCQLFNTDHSTDPCAGCPVFAKTGVAGCDNTPYDDWMAAEGLHETANTPQLRKIARAEIKFLKSLVPSNRQVAGTKQPLRRWRR